MPQKYAWDTIDWDEIDETYAHFYFLNEIRGCLYSKSTKLSVYQEANRNSIQALVDYLKAENECLSPKDKISRQSLITNLFLGNKTLKDINFDGLDLSQIRIFREIKKCTFTNCKLFILKGKFVDCSFGKLQNGSFIHPLIAKDCSYIENGNILTADKSILVEVSDFDRESSFAKLSSITISKIKYVCINSFAQVVPDKVIIPNSINAVFAFSGVFSAKELFVGPDTKIVNFEVNYYGLIAKSLSDIVNVIHCANSNWYFESVGCIYGKMISANTMQKCYNGDAACRQLLWINKCDIVEFDETIAIVKFSRPEFYIPYNNTIKIIGLPKQVLVRKSPTMMQSYFVRQNQKMIRDSFINELLRKSSSIEKLKNVPDDVKIINGFVFLDGEIIYDLDHNRSLLYVPEHLINSLLKNKVTVHIKYMIVPNNFVLRKFWCLDNAVKLMKLFNIETDEKWSKKLSGTVIPHLRNDYLYEFVKEHIKKIDELSSEEQEDILRQQKEWDKYLNN